MNEFLQKIADSCRNIGSSKQGNISNKSDLIENQNNQKHNQTNKNDQANSDGEMQVVVQECDSLKNSQSTSPEITTQQQQILNQTKSKSQDLKKEIDPQIILTHSQSSSSIFSGVNSQSQVKPSLDNRQNQANQSLDFFQNQANQSLQYYQNQAKQNLGYYGNHANHANQNLDYYQNQTNQSLDCRQNQANQNFDCYQNQANQNLDYYQNQANQNFDCYQNQANQSLYYYQNQAKQNQGYCGNQAYQNLDYFQNQANQNFNDYRNQTNNAPSQLKFQKGPNIINIPKQFTPTIYRMDPSQNFYTEQIFNQQPYQQDFQVRKEQFQPQIAHYQQPENKKIKILQRHNNVNQNNFQNINQPTYSTQVESQKANNYQQTNNMNEIQRSSQIKQIDQSFHSFTSSIALTEYKSCDQDNQDIQSYAQTQLVKCSYCKKDIHKQYIQLNCQHFYCQACLKEFLQNQSKQIDCYAYKCFCSYVIKLEVLFKERDKDREAEILKEKLINNQINALRLNIQQKYQLKTCCNKCCKFFVILQQNLDQKYFYCPQCLERQVEVQLNQQNGS